MSALLVLVLDVEDSDDRRAVGFGATEAAAAVLRQALPAAPVEVVTRAGRLTQLLETPSDLVLVHDPRHPLDGPDPVLEVLDEWHRDGQCVAAVGCVEVTDTLKHVDRDSRVVTTLDRSGFHGVTGPLVVTHAALGAALAVAPQAAADLGLLAATLDRLVGLRRVLRAEARRHGGGRAPMGGLTVQVGARSPG